VIKLRKDNEHRFERSPRHEVWFTFCSRNTSGPLAHGFGTAECINDSLRPLGSFVRHRTRRDTEIVTYVHRGATVCEDSIGPSGFASAGQFLRMTAGRGIRRTETNLSRTDSVHIFQIWLRPPSCQLPSNPEQTLLPSADRRAVICVVASHTGRRSPLRIQNDEEVYSAVLNSGQHIVHTLDPGRAAWVHVVQGSVKICEFILAAGDSAGIAAQRSVTISAIIQSEILLVDVGHENDCVTRFGRDVGQVPEFTDSIGIDKRPGAAP